MAAVNPSMTSLSESDSKQFDQLQQQPEPSANIQQTHSATSSDDDVQVFSSSDSFSRFWHGIISAKPVAVTPVGQLLPLHPNTLPFGFMDEAKYFYIRPCYPLLLIQLKDMLTLCNRRRGVLVTGVEGIGKSFFAAYMMRHFHSEGRTVVFEDKKQRMCWLLSPTGGAAVQEGSLYRFHDYLDKYDTIYICDVTEQRFLGPISCGAFTIVISWPNADCYGSWFRRKQAYTLYMPSWSLDEVKAVVPSIYPQRYMSDGVTSIYTTRFNKFGGIARTIFSRHEDTYLDEELTKAIRSTDLDHLFDSILTSRIIGRDHHLIDYVIDMKADGTPDFSKVTVDFASDYIYEHVMKEKMKYDPNQIESFLLRSRDASTVAAMHDKVARFRDEKAKSDARTGT